MSAWQAALRCTCARLVRSAPVQRRLCTLHAPARCAQGFRISQNLSERTLLWKAVHPSGPRSSAFSAPTLVNCVRAASTKTPAVPADDLFKDDDIDDILAGVIVAWLPYLASTGCLKKPGWQMYLCVRKETVPGH
jgi:hypothetical protein